MKIFGVFSAFCLLFFSFSNALLNANFQQDLLTATNEEETVLFDFILARSGAHTQTVLYSESEYDSYQLPRDDLFNKISVMGMSQAWSLGNHIRNSLPSLFQDISLDSVKAYYMNIEKSQVTVEYFLMGLYGKTPNWQVTDFADQNVWKNLQAGGNCFGCPLNSVVDLDALFSGETVTEEIEVPLGEENLDQLTVHSVNACPRLLSNYHVPSVMGAVNDNFFYNVHMDQIGDYYDYISQLYTETEKSMIVNVRLLTFLVWEAHRVHMLPEVESIPEFLRKIMTVENLAASERHHFLNIVYQQEEYVKVTSSRMMEKIKTALLDAIDSPSSLKAILYAVHDNNLASFLISLLGRDLLETDWLPNRPAFSSSLQVVLKADSYGGYFINLLVNHEARAVEGCGVDCPLSEFVEKLNGLIIPDLVAYCKDYPNE
jgi:hypothetical protein